MTINQSKFRILIGLSILSLLIGTIGNAETYKYKDVSGKWVFSDKKPVSNIEFEKVDVAVFESAHPEPIFTLEKDEAKNVLKVTNPIYAPMEISVWWEDARHKPIEMIIPANNEVLVISDEQSLSNYMYDWHIGSPDADARKFLYQVPIGSDVPHVVTQGFLGRFSHYVPSSEYAIDIAADVGTPVIAARPGTVAWVKDDYHLSGTQVYFLDKANFVSVLHDDGTYATYAHTLLGSATVKPGDQVEAGQMVAKTGNSGFSTGPHLHFVIQRNAGMKTVSVPFQIADRNNEPIVPRTGMQLFGKLSKKANGQNTVKDIRTITAIEFVDTVDESSEEETVEQYTERVELEVQCEVARMDYVKFLQDLPMYRGDDGVLRVEWLYSPDVGEKIYLSSTEFDVERAELEQTIQKTCEFPDSEEILGFYEQEWLRNEHCAWRTAEAEKAADPRKANTREYIERRQELAASICNGEIDFDLSK